MVEHLFSAVRSEWGRVAGPTQGARDARAENICSVLRGLFRDKSSSRRSLLNMPNMFRLLALNLDLSLNNPGGILNLNRPYSSYVSGRLFRLMKE